MSTAIIVPTYNSAKTISKLIKKILNKTSNSTIYIVDDNSPDGTAKEVKRHFSRQKRVKLFIRDGKGGRGSAVLYGFKQALKNKSNKYFVEMDSDLCHDPIFINNMVEACNLSDVAIASRYVKGSKNVGWKLKRQIFSRIVSLYLRLMLGVPIKDYTNGFRCYKRRYLEKIDFSEINSKGFFVISELAYKLYQNGAKFKEIPFTFRLYQFGKSNLNKSELKEAFFQVIRIKLQQLLAMGI